MGTAEYVSPELLQEKTTSHASDLWAIGCIVYQMVAGLPPFRSRWETPRRGLEAPVGSGDVTGSGGVFRSTWAASLRVGVDAPVRGEGAGALVQ